MDLLLKEKLEEWGFMKYASAFEGKKLAHVVMI